MVTLMGPTRCGYSSKAQGQRGSEVYRMVVFEQGRRKKLDTSYMQARGSLVRESGCGAAFWVMLLYESRLQSRTFGGRDHSDVHLDSPGLRPLDYLKS